MDICKKIQSLEPLTSEEISSSFVVTRAWTAATQPSVKRVNE